MPLQQLPLPKDTEFTNASLLSLSYDRQKRNGLICGCAAERVNEYITKTERLQILPRYYQDDLV